MPDQPTDIVPFVTEITTDLVREVRSRISGYDSLSDEDRDAIVTGVSKAAWRGILRGVGILAHDFNAQQQALLETDPDSDVVRLSPELQVDDEPDLWADRYGEQGGSSD